MGPLSSASAAHAGPGEVVALLLAGFLSEAEASASLGVDNDDLESLLGELGLLGAAMVPIEIDQGLATTFVDLGRSAFSAPLFDDVVDHHRRAGRPPRTPRFRLSADLVLGAAAGRPLSCPVGLILHVGRCGSTLLCDLLATVTGLVALKEPELVNGLLLRLAAEHDPVARDRLGALVALLLRSLAHGVRLDADGHERACIVKLTSWNAMFADEFVWRLDPSRLVVLTRDPWATVASLLQDPPYWYDGRPTLSASRSSARARRLETASLYAQAWSGTVEQALRFPVHQALFVTYAELVNDPVAVLGRVCRHLLDGHQGPDMDAVGRLTGRYSKGASGEPFEPNGRHRRDALDEEVRHVVTTITARTWAELIERTSPAGC